MRKPVWYNMTSIEQQYVAFIEGVCNSCNMPDAIKPLTEGFMALIEENPQFEAIGGFDPRFMSYNDLIWNLRNYRNYKNKLIADSEAGETYNTGFIPATSMLRPSKDLRDTLTTSADEGFNDIDLPDNQGTTRSAGEHKLPISTIMQIVDRRINAITREINSRQNDPDFQYLHNKTRDLRRQ